MQAENFLDFCCWLATVVRFRASPASSCNLAIALFCLPTDPDLSGKGLFTSWLTMSYLLINSIGDYLISVWKSQALSSIFVRVCFYTQNARIAFWARLSRLRPITTLDENGSPLVARAFAFCLS
jgi:hypothetical protein